MVTEISDEVWVCQSARPGELKMQAEAEGVEFKFLAVPRQILGGIDGAVRGLDVVKAVLGDFDTFGRRMPVPTDQTKSFPATR